MNVNFLNAPTLASKIPKLAKSCRQMDICIAYIKIKGLRKLISVIEGLINRGGSVRIVFGLSRGLSITDKESVKELLALSRNTKVDVKRFDNPSFHPKLYIFHGDSPSIIVGSSNLTNAAITDNVEANLLVQDVDENLFREVKKFFNECYEKALPLTEEDLSSYKAVKTRRRLAAEGRSEDELPIQRNFDEIGSFDTIGELLAKRKKNRFYLMHLSYGEEGYREECWQFATEYDLIGLSALEVYDDWAKIREEVKDKLSPVWIGQFDRFCANISNNSMNIGDLVIVLWGQTHLLGVAEVLGDHYYCEEYTEKFFDHVRPVNWLVEYDNEKKIKIPTITGFVNTLDLVKKSNDRWHKLAKVRF